jgi:hypothetical protein
MAGTPLGRGLCFSCHIFTLGWPWPVLTFCHTAQRLLPGLSRRVGLVACALIFRQFIGLWVLRTLDAHHALPPALSRILHIGSPSIDLEL